MNPGTLLHRPLHVKDMEFVRQACFPLHNVKFVLTAQALSPRIAHWDLNSFSKDAVGAGLGSCVPKACLGGRLRGHNESGGACRNRTDDILLAKQALSHLS